MFHKGKIFLLNKYQSVMDWERQTSYEITYMWNLKKRLQMNFSTKQKQLQVEKINLWGEEEEGINCKIGIDIYTPLHIKWITNKSPLHSTGNSTQHCVMASVGKESKKEYR